MFVRNIFNNLDFWLRRKIKISRGKYSPPNELKDCLFDDIDIQDKALAELKEKEYLEKYNLYHLKENSTRLNYIENLYRIELLEANLAITEISDTINILDIGSKNWFYAASEYNFFKYKDYEKNIYLTGIELDAFRLYTSLYSRYDYAQHFIKGLENTQYIVDNLLNHHGKYDYITWFFPFITPNPLLSWGLPLKHFKPEEMLHKAYDCLNPNGKLLIVNQGKEEYQIQKDLLRKLNISYKKKGNFKSVFLKYEYDRFVIIVDK